MKKLALALVCLVSVAFFASCDPKEIENPEPTIALITGDDFVYGTVENPQVIDLTDGVNWQFGFHVESNAQTKKELSSLKIVYELVEDGETMESTETIDLTGKTSYDYIDYVFEQPETKDVIYEYIIRATVTDVDNQTMTATIAIKADLPAVTLEDASFAWVRKGQNLQGTTEDEMKALGLKWTGSHKEIFATWETVDDATVSMWICDGADYETIKTDIDKYNYFYNLLEAEPVTEYRNITTAHSADYNDMLAIATDDGFFLIHITRAEIETGNFGTQITAKGEWK